MPGMNQLGGAQTVTKTSAAPQNTENQPAPSAQDDAGVQAVPNDAVKGVDSAKQADGESTDDRSGDARRGQRQFSQLSNGRRRRVDDRTGAVVELSQKQDIKAAEARDRSLELAEVEEQNREAAQSNKARLEKAIAGDLFAKPFKVQAEPPTAQQDDAIKPASSVG
jgi:hypothetical protein